MGCDVQVFPARKWLRGAKGVSVLYLLDRALRQLGAPPSLDIASAARVSAERHEPHPDRRRFEAFEFSPGVRLALKSRLRIRHRLGPGKNRCASDDCAARGGTRFGGSTCTARTVDGQSDCIDDIPHPCTIGEATPEPIGRRWRECQSHHDAICAVGVTGKRQRCAATTDAILPHH